MAKHFKNILLYLTWHSFMYIKQIHPTLLSSISVQGPSYIQIPALRDCETYFKIIQRNFFFKSNKFQLKRQIPIHPFSLHIIYNLHIISVYVTAFMLKQNCVALKDCDNDHELYTYFYQNEKPSFQNLVFEINHFCSSILNVWLSSVYSCVKSAKQLHGVTHTCIPRPIFNNIRKPLLLLKLFDARREYEWKRSRGYSSHGVYAEKNRGGCLAYPKESRDL